MTIKIWACHQNQISLQITHFLDQTGILLSKYHSVSCPAALLKLKCKLNYYTYQSQTGVCKQLTFLSNLSTPAFLMHVSAQNVGDYFCTSAVELTVENNAVVN